MLYLISIIVIFNSDNCHAIFNSNNCHAIFNSDNCHAIFGSGITMLYLTPMFTMLHLTREIWHRHSVFTLVLSIYTDIWHITLDTLFMTPALGIYTGTQYMDPILKIWHTWHLHLTHGIWYVFMWYKYLDLTSRPLTGHYHPWYLYLYDIFLTITFTGTWHGYYIITRYSVLLYSCTTVYLNPWNGEALDITPNTILLLTPVIG